ncbi:hypothetical protein GH714_002470 [Hevea brasiliensis]|uniref:Uncharacterized protein n=1 Tax=Hevea brasiliensis TaxID=3981 RepID=A0A6A6KII9_HEVBR|nr:hypothetical protein GH714_002470 [Hevea brasiliensis]
MGSLADDDAYTKPMQDNLNPNFSYTDTQPFDSQIFPSSLPDEKGGNANKVQLVQNTVPFDDSVPVEDAFETQIVDLGGETQVMDDPVCLEHVDTPLIDDFSSDGEGTDKTEVLDDGGGFSDDESQRRGKRESLDGERSWHTSFEHSEDRLVEQPNENCSSRLDVSSETPTGQVSQEPMPGSIARFTSVRAASLRASGLAARRLLWREPTLGTKLIRCDTGTGRYNNEVKGLINVHDYKIGRSAVRKLFDEDFFVENEELASNNDNTAGVKEMHQLPTCDDGLAGLSYIDSQEPGESSQANAFACVQRLIEENKSLFNEFDLGKNSKGKPNFVSIAKGPQILAKKTNDRGINEKTGIFDWDDLQEDEGGGDIFCRRKEEFFGSTNLGKRSFIKTQKAKGKQLVLHNTKLNKKKTPEAEMNIRKNLVSKFDEQSNIATSVGQLEAGLARNNMPEGLDVGLDTQMAAEAMEALLCGDGIANSDANNVPGNSDSQKGSPGRKVEKSSLSKQCSFGKDYDIEVAPVQSKKTKRIGAKSKKRPPSSPQKHSAIYRNDSDMDLLKSRRKRAKSDVEVSVTNRIKRAAKMPSKMAEGTIESSLHDARDRHHGIALTGSGSVKKQNLPEEFANLTPIAHRTRNSLVATQLKRAENVSSGCGEEANCTIEISALRRNEAGDSVDAEVNFRSVFGTLWEA